MQDIKMITDEEIIKGIKENGVVTVAPERLIDGQVDAVRIGTVSCKMWIDECQVNEEGDFSYIIKFIDICGNEKSINIPRAEFTASNIRKLINAKGGYVFDDRLMYAFLKQYEAYALGYDKPTIPGLAVEPLSLKHTYEKAGWCLVNEEPAFVSSDGCYLKKRYEERTEYVGKLAICKKGKLAEYKKMINKYIIDKKNVALQALLAMASASVLLWYFNNILRKQILNFIVHLSGEKGTGKSTSLEICASFSGRPAIMDNSKAISVYSTFNSTDGAITDLNFNNGYAIAIDDTQLCDNKLKDSTFYEFAMGQSRQRLKSNGKRAETNSEYKTGIFTSGEKGIFSVLNEGGLKPRIIELDNIQWTQDSQTADAIKNIVADNYGEISPMIAHYILDNVENGINEKLSTLFVSWENRFIDEAKKRCVYIHDTPRFVKTLALFMVALDILSKGLNQTYDTEAVYQFFFDNVVIKKGKEEQNSANVYNQLVDYIIMNNMKFSYTPNERVADIKSDTIENAVEDKIIFLAVDEEEEYMGEIIRNTNKIAARVKGAKCSAFLPTADALYILEEELGVKDINRFLGDMLDDHKLIWNETQVKKNKKVPRLDSKYHGKRGYRLALPEDFMKKVEEFVKQTEER